MADFVDSEAEESEDEELSPSEKKRAKRQKTIDSEEEEEDDDDRLREELKDLIDDAPIEEDESDGEDSDASGAKKRKKSDDEEYDDRLEDDDYDLLEENLGHKIERKKKFKRLRRIDDDESGDERVEEEGEEREAIANELFEGSDNEEGERTDRPPDESELLEEEEGDYSDDDGFIVDDEGRPIAEKRKKRKPIFTDAALQEAQDIFGVDFDFDDLERFADEGEESEEDEYVEDENEEETRRRREKKKVRKPSRKSIFEIYEPSELKRGHFTDLDNEIRSTDIPERMQIRDVPVTPATETELEEEAEWVYKWGFCKPTVSIQDERHRKSSQAVGKIKKALEFMRNQNFEVPFIAFYRKEYVLPELTIGELWRVYKLDEKWCQLRTRKNTLLTLMERMKEYQEEQLTADLEKEIPAGVRVITEDDIFRLRAVQSPEELKDVHQHFLLYYSHEIPTMLESFRKKEKQKAKEERARKRAEAIANGDDVEGEPEEAEEEDTGPSPEETIKQANRSGPYAMCRKAGIDGLAKRFGLTPAHFAENLRDNYQRNDVDQEAVEPTELAKEYCTKQFSTTDEVLRAAKFVVATQLSKEPLVRKCVREAFFESSKIDVVPTKKGQKEVDENHPCYSMKYLTGKPVRELENDQFLKLVMAEEDKMLTITFDEKLPGLTSPSYVEEAKQLYYRDEFSRSVQEWNTLRVECVEFALKKIIFPELRKELKSKLIAEARECVLRASCRKLYDWIKVAPYTAEFEGDDDAWDTSKGVRVLGVAFVPDYDQAAFAALIGPDGDCSEHLRIPHLLKRKSSYNPEDAQLKEADLQAIRNLILTRKPHVVVIGGESREAIMVQQDIQQIVSGLVEDEDFVSINVHIMDNELSKLYANSKKGESDFRDFPLLLRQAISLARRMQDPLIEFSQLCTSDEEILCLRYHPLQDQVPQQELLEWLYLEFVNRTNEVGVDINKAILEPYTSHVAQFICGLGPRKAAALLKTLKQNNLRLENRTQLVTLCHLGPKVFINAAGFIKIDTNSLGDSTEAYVEVLDGTRVHPETYEWARKMAVDALEYDEEEGTPAGALEEILDSPERLKDLDLDAFAEELERQGFGNKSVTLYDIRSELNHRYRDLRGSYRPPTFEELFEMLTKETRESFHVGKMILAKVVSITHKKPKGEQLDQANPVRNDETGLWQCPFCLKNDFPELSEVWNHFDAGSCPGQATGVRVRLDNGVVGYIHVRNISDKHVTNPEDRVRIGQTVHARVTKIDMERFSCECTSRTSDLIDKDNNWRPKKDRFYDSEAEARDIKLEEDSKKNKARQQYIKRVIVHPSFHNVGYAEAEKIMAGLEQGEAIIRPSSKGANHLTVTWKVTDKLLQHIDVREEGKENAFSLGQSLWIGNEEFEDLDEILARHITPMAAHARDIANFKVYREFDGGKEKVEEALREEKKKNPNKIHYFITPCKSLPGKFLLAYLPRVRCRHEYITVTADGFRFRSQMFDSLPQLLKWFKEHFRDPIPGTPGTPRASRNSAPNIKETIQRVVDTIPNHMLQNLSQVAATPHYPTATPGQYHYANTPYTPSGQTPFMTPYLHTPRYGAQTPTAAAPVHPPYQPPSHHPAHTPSHNSHNSHNSHTSQHRPSRGSSSGGGGGGRYGANAMDWQKAAEAWAKDHTGSHTPRDRDSRATPRGTPRGTPRNDGFATPRGPVGTPKYDDRRRHHSSRESVKSFGTPMTNTSPRSMVESSIGDGTPLYDEN